jgi:hypothetical protein
MAFTLWTGALSESLYNFFFENPSCTFNFVTYFVGNFPEMLHTKLVIVWNISAYPSLDTRAVVTFS